VSVFFAPLAILIIFGSGAIIDRIIKRRINPSVTQGEGRYPGFYLSGSIAVGLAVLLLVAIAIMHSWDDWPFLLALVLLGIGVCIYLLRSWLVNRWDWDNEGVRHTSGKRVTMLRWGDITGGKWLIGGGWRIHGLAGSISCWFDIIGYDVLSEALIKHRPDLAHITSLRA
jgi:MFS family permease